ncbi:2,3-diketo-5-methylthiopentyl-1-phosphate enolase [Bacillus horti]|uniref:2,3-diketo-5-methylthiopentyl-1-phosphate enolase n=1 Tax=Caldalkalibacillus horti TaxID=77523 RepID=A0ABT9W030_9BACI|nr:2,3-diketo-5-methylthiopentyl-1-phosphate enolase [Bacillus horti]MDQ0166589.1 2,3-diketo-5-methylthiopentyl-1-phosphate enolase [Bacillus horti]
MSTELVVATYLVFDAKGDFEKKAEKIAIGLTVGSWTDLPQAQKEQMKKHLGRVISVEEVKDGSAQERSAVIRIGYPTLNFSHDIPALLVTVFGKLSMDGKIKLLDLDFPESFINAFSGPKFGIDGVRELLGVYDRPLLMSIFKSCIGQDLQSLEEQFYQQALGGVDMIKDDEILFENPLTPFEKRLEVGLKAAQRAKEQTGQQVLYAINLTGPTTELLDKAINATKQGATALLFNVLAYGYDALQRITEHPEVRIPVMAHPALAGTIYPATHHGIAASLLLGKLMRLAGADFVLFPSPYGSVAMERGDTLAIADTLRKEWKSERGKLKASFPVPSAGIHPGITPLLHEDFGLQSVMNAGGGIHGHPGGASAGGQAFRQAISILQTSSSFEQEYVKHTELKSAIDMWGLVGRK